MSITIDSDKRGNTIVPNVRSFGCNHVRMKIGHGREVEL